MATASDPLGPWTKFEGNPLLVDFGYVGGVVQTQGKYRLYTAHPIGSTGPDYSPMSLAQADLPTGPWIRWPQNPVLAAGPQGAWDDGRGLRGREPPRPDGADDFSAEARIEIREDPRCQSGSGGEPHEFDGRGKTRCVRLTPGENMRSSDLFRPT